MILDYCVLALLFLKCEVTPEYCGVRIVGIFKAAKERKEDSVELHMSEALKLRLIFQFRPIQFGLIKQKMFFFEEPTLIHFFSTTSSAYNHSIQSGLTFFFAWW